MWLLIKLSTLIYQLWWSVRDLPFAYAQYELILYILHNFAYTQLLPKKERKTYQIHNPHGLALCVGDHQLDKTHHSSVKIMSSRS